MIKPNPILALLVVLASCTAPRLIYPKPAWCEFENKNQNEILNRIISIDSIICTHLAYRDSVVHFCKTNFNYLSKNAQANLKQRLNEKNVKLLLHDDLDSCYVFNGNGLCILEIRNESKDSWVLAISFHWAPMGGIGYEYKLINRNEGQFEIGKQTGSWKNKY
jgi:hypothetical protein